MQNRFLYPVDIDQFEKIRQQGKVYVDKTDLMFDLVNRYTYVFLARPRRFGLSQIEAQDYAVQWSADGRKVTKCGINITSDKRNITHWRSLDEYGNVIEDKVF